MRALVGSSRVLSADGSGCRRNWQRQVDADPAVSVRGRDNRSRDRVGHGRKGRVSRVFESVRLLAVMLTVHSRFTNVHNHVLAVVVLGLNILCNLSGCWGVKAGGRLHRRPCQMLLCRNSYSRPHPKGLHPHSPILHASTCLASLCRFRQLSTLTQQAGCPFSAHLTFHPSPSRTGTCIPISFA